MNTITAVYTSFDRVRKVRTFKTLKGAAKFVDKWTGFVDYAEFTAVSGDGVGMVRLTNGGVTVQQLKDVLDLASQATPGHGDHSLMADRQECDACVAEMEASPEYQQMCANEIGVILGRVWNAR